ncbi:MAG TPA: tetratricopeptide repeat protein [Gammaproteobacteria bacterium]|nr:tetratricopeptide repeat protein [Gammaproteobacteria bacterium]
MRHLLSTLALSILCGSAAGNYANALDDLPTIGDPINRVLTSREEYQLGQALLTRLRHELPIVEDIELNYYLNNLGARLLSHAGASAFPFHFLILDSPVINAFAAPGGIIVVHTGLINLARNEDELAGVLAHEIAHVTQRHLARFYQKSSKMDLGATLGIIAAIIASANSAAAGQAALYAGLAANASAKLAFTRANEREADRIGRMTLEKSGFDPNAMGRFFERLRDASMVNEETALEFLQTHPLPSARIADQLTFDRKHPEPEESGSKDSLDFALFRARAQGLSQALPQQSDRGNRKDWVIFARATQLLNNTRPEDALKALRSLSKAWRNSFGVRLLVARAELKNHNTQAALRALENLVQTWPDNPAAIEALANAYLDAGKPKKAYDLLTLKSALTHRWLPLLKLKAAAASRAGKQAVSHATMASYYLRMGLPSAAMAQVEIAERLPATSEVNRAKLELLKKRIKKAAENK